MKFYVYIHLRLDDGQIFYVGKGSGNRAFSYKDRNIYWKRIVKKHGLICKIVEKFCEEENAISAEVELIAKLKSKGIVLANLTDGGEGLCNPSAETRLKISQKAKLVSREYTKTDSFKSKMSLVSKGSNNGMYGKPQSEKCKLINSAKAKLRTGRNSARFKGWWICGEYGKFGSKPEAEKVIGKSCVRFRCLTSKSDKWKDWYFEPVNKNGC